jgi:hypothetical protein
MSHADLSQGEEPHLQRLKQRQEIKLSNWKWEHDVRLFNEVVSTEVVIHLCLRWGDESVW